MFAAFYKEDKNKPSYITGSCFHYKRDVIQHVSEQYEEDWSHIRKNYGVFIKRVDISIKETQNDK